MRLGHVAIPTQNPTQVAGFYGELLGMKVTLDGSNPALGDFVFLSHRPQEELQVLALQTNPQARHIAFEVDTLSSLRDVYADAKSRGIPVAFALNHRVTLSLYFFDPEGNCVEVYWPTGQMIDRSDGSEGSWNAPPEPLDPQDLERPDSDLLELVGRSLSN